MPMRLDLSPPAINGSSAIKVTILHLPHSSQQRKRLP
jgi:hypothetical protein